MPAQYFKKGASLIEMIIALALLSGVFVSTFGARWMVGDLSLNNARAASGISLANSRLIAHLDGQNYESITNSLGVTESLKTNPFTRCQYTAGSEAVWKNGWRSVSTTTSFVVMSDLSVAQKYGMDCGGQPKHFLADQFEVAGDAISLGAQVTSVDISNGHAFVSLRPPAGSVPVEPDFAIVALHDPYSTRFLTAGFGINKIDVANDYAFAAHHSSSSQLLIIDISEPDEARVVASSTLPGVAGARPEAVSIFYFDSKIYVGTKRTAGHEFHVFDVSNPQLPVWLGSREVNHNINEIVVKDGFAFLATSGNIRDLIVLDVHDPSAIAQVSAVDLPGNEDGRSIYVAHDTILLGRHKSIVPTHDELQILKYEIGGGNGLIEITLGDSVETGADVLGITYAGGYVFAATGNSQKEIQIFKIDQSGRLSLVGDKNLPANATSIDFEDEIFAVTSGNELNILEQQ